MSADGLSAGGDAALAELARVVAASRLVPPGSTGIALVSGGQDSACLAAGLAGHLGGDRVVALTLNYGLRETADRDEAACRELCERLGIELVAERPELEAGNLQAAAREARYAAAERLRARRGADWIATGHTRTDQVETLLYRLAVAPGARSLLGLPARRGRIVRPLLALERADTRRLAERAGLPFAEDPTNLDPRFARNRIRAEVLPALRELTSHAERNVAETRAELAEDAELIERVTREALDEASAGAGAPAIRLEALERMEPALRRHALRALAERAGGGEVPLGRSRAAEILRLLREPGGGELDLGSGLRVVCEQGLAYFSARPAEQPPGPERLPIPGSCRFGRWELSAELLAPPVEPAGPEHATLDAGALGESVLVRAWREGDRMRPLGLDGTKSLQDLFTDRHVPRSLRRTLPVVESEGRIAWVAGVAVSEDFRLTPDTGEVAVIRARAAEAPR